MTVKDGVCKLNDLDILYDNFIAFTDEHKKEEFSPIKYNFPNH